MRQADVGAVTCGPPMMVRLVGPVGTACCAIAGAAYVGRNDPQVSGRFFGCPFRTVTGWWCPGCGLTRAVHHLIRGDLTGALHLNALVGLYLVIGMTGWMAWVAWAVDRPVHRDRSSMVPVSVAVGLVVVGFAVVRNLPGVSGLRG